MKKDAYYFPHDSNAKDDPKSIILIEELGLEGYGIFWVLVETLRDQTDYKAKLRIIPGLARRYNTTSEKMKAVVARYDLFEIENDEFFYSKSLIHRMLPLDQKREKARIAGKKSAEKRFKKFLKPSKITSPTTDVQRSFNAGSTDVQPVKQNIVDESKEKKSSSGRFTPPMLHDVQVYMKEKGGNVSEAERFFDFYESKGWLVGKAKMKDWKAAVRNWVSRNKEQKTNQTTYEFFQ